MSPAQRPSTRTAGVAGLLLSGWRVGISVSESPDMERLGFGGMHLEDAIVEFARFLLANGAALAYGGDLRVRGFSKMLFQVAEAHNRASGSSHRERIADFLAWPLHLKKKLPDSERAKWMQSACFHDVPLPRDLKVARNTYLEPDSPENSYVWARCLTAMREEMNHHIDARVLLGGKVSGFRGKYPGIAEEGYLALRDGFPLYPAGGFGGCAKAVTGALLRRRPEVFSDIFQFKNREYAAMVGVYNDRATSPAGAGLEPVDYGGLRRFFEKKGVAGLNNGLSTAENKRLFETIHVPEMIALVLKGLRSLDRKKAGRIQKRGRG
ncbi:MAG: hypothetical protein WC899_07170 [bacterium]|jgi:hypothetical protein